MIRLLSACILLCAFFIVPAQAKPHRQAQCIETGTLMAPSCGMGREQFAKSAKSSGDFLQGVRSIRVTMKREVRTRANNASVQVLPHPSGCPRFAFCGCGASVEVFGRPIRNLFLAANWLKFPRTAPAPGMVAARRGHVFVIREVLGSGRVLAYDANSGRRQTRLHVRSLAGFSVVNPHGAG